MRVLFVSGTTVGGSGRSQRQLAALLSGMGHELLIVADDESRSLFRRFAYGHLSDLAARLRTRVGSRPVRLVEGLPGRRGRRRTLDGVSHLITPVPENAFVRVVHDLRPDVVVGSSISRLGWRKIRTVCDAQRIATILYIREMPAMNHFEFGDRVADAVVANAVMLAEEVRARGYECEFLPSAIDTSVTITQSTRTVALVVNPIETHGVVMIRELAPLLPTVPFVLQESWPLSVAQRRWIDENVLPLPNVEFRRAVAPGPQLYGDAKVLLVPHRVDNRPRVIAEVQANGIPVIVSDLPGLREAMGNGGLCAAPDDVEAWRRTLEEVWSDPAIYDSLVANAARHSRREEIQPDRVALRFAEILHKVSEERPSPAA